MSVSHRHASSAPAPQRPHRRGRPTDLLEREQTPCPQRAVPLPMAPDPYRRMDDPHHRRSPSDTHSAEWSSPPRHTRMRAPPELTSAARTARATFGSKLPSRAPSTWLLAIWPSASTRRSIATSVRCGRPGASDRRKPCRLHLDVAQPCRQLIETTRRLPPVARRRRHVSALSADNRVGAARSGHPGRVPRRLGPRALARRAAPDLVDAPSTPRSCDCATPGDRRRPLRGRLQLGDHQADRRLSAAVEEHRCANAVGPAHARPLPDRSTV